MAAHKDAVGDTTATTGTGTVTIAGVAVTGFRTFASALTDGDTVRYRIQQTDNSEWECGVGTWSSGASTLTRGGITASSNSGSAVNFSAGTKGVFLVVAAADLVVSDTVPSAGQIPVGNAGGTAYAPVAMSGDATLASTGAITIANSAVTLAKIANAAAASKLVGSGASGSGAAYSEITLGTGLSMTGTTLNAAAAGATLGANTFTAAQEVDIATSANTSADGLNLFSTTAASAANQQFSPRLHFKGFGWKTTATAASQAVEYTAEVQPVQGTANPTGNLVFSYSVNGGAFAPVATIKPGGGFGSGISSSFFDGGGSAVDVGYDAISQSTIIRFASSSINFYVSGQNPLVLFSNGIQVKQPIRMLTSFAQMIAAKSANYTVSNADHTLEGDATSGAIVFTLPAISGVTPGTEYIAIKTDATANAVGFKGNSAETISGSNTQNTTAQWGVVRVKANTAHTAWLLW